MTSTYIWAGILLVIVVIIKSPWFKGWIGEVQVNLLARLLLDKKKYHLIRNVTLSTEQGTTQIDHIIVSPFGIFVVETKNMKGWIFGKENDAEWTQKIYRQSRKFMNPLRQNYKHTRVLAETLGIPHEKCKSVIVFIGDSKFKTKMAENVTQASGYIRYIRSHTSPVLTDEIVEESVRTINQRKLSPGLRTYAAHVRHVKDIRAQKTITGKKNLTQKASECIHDNRR